MNSGRATREHDIEDTALKTNLEAAEEVARQLRLRDLAGLIVIDFIDMEEKRNNRAVEKKLNDCLKNDRARIQVGRISPFGLMEMSRQRIRTGLLESSSIPCPHCGGSGFVRATASVALHILRSIEEALLKSASHNLILRTRTEVALYILNQKRAHLHEIEVHFGVTVTIAADERLPATSAFQLDRGEPAQRAEGPVTGVRATAISPSMEFEDEAEDEIEETETAEVAEAASGEAGTEEAREDGEGRRRRRRRRRRGGRTEGQEAARAAPTRVRTRARTSPPRPAPPRATRKRPRPRPPPRARMPPPATATRAAAAAVAAVAVAAGWSATASGTTRARVRPRPARHRTRPSPPPRNPSAPKPSRPSRSRLPPASSSLRRSSR